jgi:hypothetical protein
MNLNTPVAFIIFNRPDKTQRVLRAIAEARPRRLFVIADGPREGQPADVEKCAAARALIEQVDWDCEVVKNYSDVNLGCGRRPATGISWVFDHAEEAIILEDDCLPHPTFFRFCSELLNKYRDDERVMMVGGFTFFPQDGPYSYYFSGIPACVGGWATWRRAWQHWEARVTRWPELRNTSWLLDTLGHAGAAKSYRSIFDRAHADGDNADYWDYQWMYACWLRKGLTILPSKVNLISNIGFDREATHTTTGTDRRANLPTQAMEFPLRHPSSVVRDRTTDHIRLETFHTHPHSSAGSRWSLRRIARRIQASLRAPTPRSVAAGNGR